MKCICFGPSRTQPFRSLPPDLLARLESIGRDGRLARNEFLVSGGEHFDQVGFVVQGVLRMEKTLIDGDRNIVGLLVAGDMFGRVFDGPLPFSIAAATDCDLCLFPKAQFESLMEESPELERIVILNLLHELDSVREWLGLIANHRTIDRVAGFLVFLHRRWAHLKESRDQPSHGTQIDLPISRQDLADVLGTRPEGISRAFHALQDRQLIEIVTPYQFVIYNYKELERMFGQCLSETTVYSALKAE